MYGIMCIHLWVRVELKFALTYTLHTNTLSQTNALLSTKSRSHYTRAHTKRVCVLTNTCALAHSHTRTGINNGVAAPNIVGMAYLQYTEHTFKQLAMGNAPEIQGMHGYIFINKSIRRNMGFGQTYHMG